MYQENNLNPKIIELNMDESSTLENLFNIKTEKMKNMDIKLDNETKLKFYGLYKVVTVGKFSESNKKPAGFFDFAEKYKNQAWEKCSGLSKSEAMIEYIKLFNHVSGEKDEDIIYGKDQKLTLHFDDLDIPEDYEGSFIYSSNATQAKKEINEYLMNSSDSEKLFYTLKDKIYNGDNITPEYLKEFSQKNNFDLLNSKDSLGQTLLHVAVDGMNYSAVKSLVDLEIAEKLINSTDNFLMTPMHMAAMNFDVEIFLLLNKLKPNMELKDSENKTCLEYLKENEEIDENIMGLIKDMKL